MRKVSVRLAGVGLHALLALCIPLSTLAEDADFDRQVDKLLEAESLPGIAWAVVGDSGPVSGAGGLAEIANGRPMTADTRVQVGSVTKTVLSLGVLRLVSEGQLGLDDNVEQLLPMLNWRNPWRDQAPVTVRHLLEHTAGLDNIRLWQFLNSAVTANTPLTDAFPPDHRQLLRLRSVPGSQYAYSNMGYALLGMVIERVTGQRYEDYLAQSLLAPLGMRNSSFHLVTQGNDPRLAMGYLDDGVPQPAVPMVLRPAGQFTTTAQDMSRFLAFMLGDGSVEGAPLIAPALMAQLGTPSTTEAYRHGLDIGHGLALAARDRHGVLGECHPGTSFGFRAYLCLFRGQHKAFFYAINADVETADYESFNRLFIERLAPDDAALAVPTAGAGDLSAFTGLYELSPNSMAQFAWLDWMFNSAWLSEDARGGSLVMRSLQQPTRRLLPLGNGLFRDAERRLPSHVFMDGEDMLLSNGLATWRRASPEPLLFGWLSLVLGAAGLFYIAVRGSWLLVRRDRAAGNSLLLPWLGIAAFALPAFLYTRQDFLEFGEKTAASVSVAMLTGALPLLLIVGLLRLQRHKRMFTPDLLALTALLQLCLVLLYQGVLPVVFWR